MFIDNTVFIFVYLHNMTEKFTNFITLNGKQIRQEGNRPLQAKQTNSKGKF